MNLFKSKAAKVFVGIAGLAIALAFVVTPVKSEAQTIEQQIAALLAQIQLLQGQMGGGSSMGGSSYTFNNDLTLGSEGSDVVALQTKLEEAGFLTMPAGVAKGYFGALTKAAVTSWQASVGLPNTGFFGPMSRAKLNSMGGGSTGGNFPAGCTSSTGFSSTTGMPCSGAGQFPAGCTSTAGFSTTTGMPCNSTTPGTGTTVSGDGRAVLSYNGFSPSSQTIKKGETKPVIAVKIQATNGGVSVNRFSFNIGASNSGDSLNARPWLYFSKATLKTASGQVLAEKMLSGSGDSTEITVGSNYQINFDNVSHVVNPGSDSILVVELTALVASDKFPETLYVAVPSGAIRTVNGIGFSETVGLSSGQGASPITGTCGASCGNTITLTADGSVADIYTSISPSTPSTGFRTVASGTTITENVTLGVFRVKAQNTAGTMTGINFVFGTNGVEADDVFSQVRVEANGQTYYASSLATSTSFSNMTIPLPLDAWVDLTLKASVAGASVSSGVIASSTMDGSTITGYDANFNSLGVSNATDVTSNNLTFLQSGLNVTSASTMAPTCIGQSPTSCTATFKVTLMNTGNNPIFISKTPGIALATTTSAGSASSTITVVTANPSAGEVAGDDADSFAINTGTSREFTFTGALRSPAGGGVAQMSITGVKFGATTGANTTFTLTSGLGNLTAVQTF